MPPLLENVADVFSGNLKPPLQIWLQCRPPLQTPIKVAARRAQPRSSSGTGILECYRNAVVGTRNNVLGSSVAHFGNSTGFQFLCVVN
jgi:hypothetical protein